MTEHKYAFSKFNKELMARAIGRDVPISTKQAIEIANHLRHRKLVQAKNLLKMVVQKKHAVPFKRFTNGLGHKPGKIASGRYPIKAAGVFLKLMESVEANAQTKGLNTGELEIIHICAHKAHSPVHYGRHSGREFKRSHVEVVVQETTGKKKGKQETEKKKEGEKKVEGAIKEKNKEEIKEPQIKEPQTGEKRANEEKKNKKEDMKPADKPETQGEDQK